jgi:hypothetical protein
MPSPGWWRSGRELPAPIGWGSERRGNAAGARCHPAMRPGSLLHCRASSRSLGLALQRAGLALTGVETPRAFHGFNPRLGTNRRGSTEGQRFAGTKIKGPHRSLDLRAPSHPCAKRMTTCPVRARRLPVAGRSFLVGPRGLPWTHRRDASNPLLQPTFRVTSTRSKNTLFGDFPPSAVGDPAGVRFEILRATGVATCRHSVRGRRRTTSRSSGLRRHRA